MEGIQLQEVIETLVRCCVKMEAPAGLMHL